VQDIKDSKYSILSFAVDATQSFIASVTDEKFINLHYLADNRQIKLKLENSANKVCITSDGNYVLVALADSKELQAYHIVKKGTTKALELSREFPNKHLKSDIISLQIAINNKFLISCGNDTTINIWTLKGVLLSSLNTRQMQNNMACISPDSTMISAAAHMSDVRIWKLRVSKEDQQLLGVEDRVFTYLRGHTSFIYWIAFTSDSKKILTCSKDNTWKLWDLDVDYNIEELPKVIMSVKLPDNATYIRVEISSDNNYFIALTEHNTNVHLWNLTTSELIDTIKSPHYGQITDMSWFPKEHKFATSGTDGTIKIFDVHHRK